MIRFIVLNILIGVLGQVGISQLVTPRSPFVLNMDYARFRNDDRTGYLELYYAFYPASLTFRQEGERLQGHVKLRVILRNTSTAETILNNMSILPVSIADTSTNSFKVIFVSQAGYAVPFGQYSLDVQAWDSSNTARRDSLSLTLEMVPGSPGTYGSDLELCSEVKNSEPKSGPFYKNSLEVVPNPSLMYGATSNPVLFHYCEFYNLIPESTYTLTITAVDAAGKVAKKSERMKRYGVTNAVDVGTLNMTMLASGRYTLSVSLQDCNARQIATLTKIFYVYNPHIKPTSAALSSAKTAELGGLSAEELAEEFTYVQYLATGKEIETFNQVTSAEGRRELLAKLWTELGAGRFGRLPVTRADYLQRIAVANQRYRSLGREGWHTDRGRVYVVYGEPEQVERFPSAQQTKPYEVWSYFQLENGVEFVFIDRSGFGDYVLVHSTKRGEIRDDEWQRLLQ